MSTALSEDTNFICGEFTIYRQLLRFDNFLSSLIKRSLFLAKQICSRQRRYISLQAVGLYS